MLHVQYLRQKTAIIQPERFFLVRRFGQQNVGEVVEKALRKKLIETHASKRVLLLERQDWRLNEGEVLTEIEHRRAQWPDLNHVDEIWIVETESEKHHKLR